MGLTTHRDGGVPRLRDFYRERFILTRTTLSLVKSQVLSSRYVSHGRLAHSEKTLSLCVKLFIGVITTDVVNEHCTSQRVIGKQQPARRAVLGINHVNCTHLRISGGEQDNWIGFIVSEPNARLEGRLASQFRLADLIPSFATCW